MKSKKELSGWRFNGYKIIFECDSHYLNDGLDPDAIFWKYCRDKLNKRNCYF